jgi:uncharacterized membrane protein YgcG
MDKWNFVLLVVARAMRSAVMKLSYKLHETITRLVHRRVEQAEGLRGTLAGEYAGIDVRG